MSGWTWLWIFWLAMFAAIEGAALIHREPGGTFSEHIWAWFSVRDKAAGWRVRRLILAVALVLLMFHFLSGGGWLVI
jgi:hypothetical protein